MCPNLGCLEPLDIVSPRATLIADVLSTKIGKSNCGDPISWASNKRSDTPPPTTGAAVVVAGSVETWDTCGGRFPVGNLGYLWETWDTCGIGSGLDLI